MPNFRKVTDPRPDPAPTRRRIRANYDTRCPECGGMIREGDWIIYHEEHESYVHEDTCDA